MQGDLSIRWWTRHPSNMAILPFDSEATKLNGRFKCRFSLQFNQVANSGGIYSKLG